MPHTVPNRRRRVAVIGGGISGLSCAWLLARACEVTLYEAENGSGLANGQPFPSLGSRDQPAQNADGSTDLFFGPKAPPGKAGNWLATVPGRGYFSVLRLYGPTEAAMDKTWKPGDFEKAD